MSLTFAKCWEVHLSNLVTLKIWHIAFILHLKILVVSMWWKHMLSFLCLLMLFFSQERICVSLSVSHEKARRELIPSTHSLPLAGYFFFKLIPFFKHRIFYNLFFWTFHRIRLWSLLSNSNIITANLAAFSIHYWYIL